MSTYSLVRSAVRQGVLKVFEGNAPAVEVIYSHQDATEPSAPYVVVQIVNTKQIGRTQTATLTDEGTAEVKNLWFTDHYEVLVQFSFTGSTAGDLAYEFNHNILNNTVIQEAFQINSLSPIRKSTVRRAPIKRETQWIEHQNMDVTFSYAVQTIQPIDWVEHVSIKDPNSGEILVIPPLP